MDHGAEDLWNKTKTVDPKIRSAMEQLENDPNHYVTVQTSEPWPGKLNWPPGTGGQTAYVARDQQNLDGSQIFLRQSDLTELNPAMPAYTLAHEVGHVLDKLQYGDNLTGMPDSDIHGPDTYSTQLSIAAGNALNIPQFSTESFGANICSPEQPIWEAPIQPNLPAGDAGQP